MKEELKHMSEFKKDMNHDCFDCLNDPCFGIKLDDDLFPKCDTCKKECIKKS